MEKAMENLLLDIPEELTRKRSAEEFAEFLKEDNDEISINEVRFTLSAAADVESLDLNELRN